MGEFVRVLIFEGIACYGFPPPPPTKMNIKNPNPSLKNKSALGFHHRIRPQIRVRYVFHEEQGKRNSKPVVVHIFVNLAMTLPKSIF